MQKSGILAGVTGLAFGVILASSPARADVLAGILKCRVSGGLSFVLGSQRDLKCLYKPNGRGSRQYYLGTTDRFGIALGFRFAGTLLWDVRSSLHDIPRLDGDYGGLGGDAKFFEGPNGDVLVGGEGGLISLKPITAGGPSGFEISAGIGRLSLVGVDRSNLFKGLEDDDID